MVLTLTFTIVVPQVLQGGIAYFFIFTCFHGATPILAGFFAFMMYYGEANIQKSSSRERSGSTQNTTTHSSGDRSQALATVSSASGPM
jgi:hypothetical protein